MQRQQSLPERNLFVDFARRRVAQSRGNGALGDVDFPGRVFGVRLHKSVEYEPLPGILEGWLGEASLCQRLPCDDGERLQVGKTKTIDHALRAPAGIPGLFFGSKARSRLHQSMVCTPNFVAPFAIFHASLSLVEGYCAVYPPSITNSLPVTNFDSSDAK